MRHLSNSPPFDKTLSLQTLKRYFPGGTPMLPFDFHFKKSVVNQQSSKPVSLLHEDFNGNQ